MKLGLAGASVIFALYLLEATIRLLPGPAAVPLRHVDRLGAVQARREGGTRAYPHMFPRNWQASEGFGEGEGAIYPLGFLSNAHVVFCGNGTTGEITEYQSDEHGFRNPRGSWSSRPQVLLVGDSFTQGFCLGAAQEPGAALRARGFRVLNVGQSGAGPLTALATVAEYGSHARPPYVFWLFYEGNDLRDLRTEMRSETLRSYLSGSGTGFTQRLIQRQDEIDSVLRIRAEQVIQDRLAATDTAPPERTVPDPAARWGPGRTIESFVKLRRLRSRLDRIRHEEEPQASIAEFAHVAARMRTTISGWGGELTVVYLPAPGRFGLGGRVHASRARPALLAVFDSLGIPVIDLVPSFRDIDSAAALFDPGTGYHYTPRGNRIMVDSIAGWLEHAEPGGRVIE